MIIDMAKLENILYKKDKITARCPACKENGHDTKGNHLVVYKNGAFACIINNDIKHNRIILKYVGSDTYNNISYKNYKNNNHMRNNDYNNTQNKMSYKNMLDRNVDNFIDYFTIYPKSYDDIEIKEVIYDISR